MSFRGLVAKSAICLLSCAAVGSWAGVRPAQAFVWPSVPERLEKQLGSPDAAERREATALLLKLPRELAAPLARKALTDEDSEVRVTAAQVAVRLRLEGSGETVIAWLAETDPRVRRAACEVLAAFPSQRAVTSIGRALSDPNRDVRLAAAQALGRTQSSEAASLLLGHLDDSSPEVRVEVAAALSRIADPKSVLPLVGKAQDSEPEVRRRVVRALGDFGDARAVSALVLALSDPSSEVRAEAARSLGRTGGDDATSALAPLLALSGDEPPASEGLHASRQAALAALAEIRSPRAIELMLAALDRDRPDAGRSPARDGLIRVGLPAVPALEALLARGVEPRLATAAAGALAGIGHAASATVIVRAMQRGTLPLLAGLDALGGLGGEGGLPAVLELLRNPSPAVRARAVETAALLLDPTRADGRAVEPLLEALADVQRSSPERTAILEALGRTGSPRAAATLVAHVSDKSAGIRRAAVVGLGHLRPAPAGTDEVDRALLGAMDDELGSVRTDAAIALSRAGSDKVGPLLLTRLLNAAEQDRAALGLALSGVMSRATPGDGKAAALAVAVGKALPSAPSSARDALLEGLGRMGPTQALALLETEARGALDDRRKVAEVLASLGPAALPTLQLLAKDPDASVRANAAWSLGFAGEEAHALLATLLADVDITVAANAAASMGRAAVSGARRDAAIQTLCVALTNDGAYVRANAVVSLTRLGARADVCAGRVVRLLQHDPNEMVRARAAAFLKAAVTTVAGSSPASAAAPSAPSAQPAALAPPAKAPSSVAGAAGAAGAGGAASPAAASLTPTPIPPNELAERALVRCGSDEPVSRVAAQCRSDVSAPAIGEGPLSMTLFVVADAHQSPLARAPFALVRPDGSIRCGLADRRGAVFEQGLALGSVELAVPAPLVEIGR